MGVMPKNTGRVYVTTGTVESVDVSEDGHLLEVTLHGDMAGVFLPAVRVATPLRGLYVPYNEGDDVVIVFPGGLIDEAVCVGKVWSIPLPPPAEAIEEPDKVWLVADDIHVKCVNLTAEATGQIQLGADNLEDLLDGVVHGRGQDTFTGATYGSLGNTSQVVKAKK